VFQISVLGPVEVRRDGRLVPVPGGKTSELLVRLALEAGVLVRADRLVEDLWAADAVNTRPNTLQSKVAKLRRAFGEAPVIAGGDGGYRLAVEPAAVDALAVLRDTVTASERLDAGDDRGGPQHVDPGAVPRGRAAGGGRRRLGQPAPGAAGRGADDADGDAVRGAVAARRRRRR
jgi:hypothetical protein